MINSGYWKVPVRVGVDTRAVHPLFRRPLGGTLARIEALKQLRAVPLLNCILDDVMRQGATCNQPRKRFNEAFQSKISRSTTEARTA